MRVYNLEIRKGISEVWRIKLPFDTSAVEFELKVRNDENEDIISAVIEKQAENWIEIDFDTTESNNIAPATYKYSLVYVVDGKPKLLINGKCRVKERDDQ